MCAMQNNGKTTVDLKRSEGTIRIKVDPGNIHSEPGNYTVFPEGSNNPVGEITILRDGFTTARNGRLVECLNGKGTSLGENIKLKGVRVG